MQNDGYCVVPDNWRGAHFGPYATLERAKEAKARLLKHQNKKRHSSCNFKAHELAIVKVRTA